MATTIDQTKKLLNWTTLPSFLKLCTAVTFLLIGTTSPSAQTSDNANPVRSTYGFTAILPGGLNVTTSQYFVSDLGLRLTAGYLPGSGDSRLLGGQAGIIWKLRELDNSLIDAGVAFGYMELKRACEADEDEFWRFVGVTGGYQWRAFFIEGGLTVGTGTYPNPQGILQIGVIFKTCRR